MPDYSIPLFFEDEDLPNPPIRRSNRLPNTIATIKGIIDSGSSRVNQLLDVLGISRPDLFLDDLLLVKDTHMQYVMQVARNAPVFMEAYLRLVSPVNETRKEGDSPVNIDAAKFLGDIFRAEITIESPVYSFVLANYNIFYEESIDSALDLIKIK